MVALVIRRPLLGGHDRRTSSYLRARQILAGLHERAHRCGPSGIVSVWLLDNSHTKSSLFQLARPTLSKSHTSFAIYWPSSGRLPAVGGEAVRHGQFRNVARVYEELVTVAGKCGDGPPEGDRTLIAGARGTCETRPCTEAGGPFRVRSRAHSFVKGTRPASSSNWLRSAGRRTAPAPPDPEARPRTAIRRKLLICQESGRHERSTYATFTR
jgi:hypothetical protein